MVAVVALCSTITVRGEEAFQPAPEKLRGRRKKEWKVSEGARGRKRSE